MKLIPELRFPEFLKDGDWKTNTLSQVAGYENGKAHEKEIAEDGQYIVVNSKFISSEGKTVKYSDKAFCLAEKGDTLMVLSDVPNGKAIAKCFYVDENNKYTVNQRVCKITSFDCENRLLYYIMDRNPYFLAFDDGVKQTNLRKDDVQGFPFLLPEIPKEQQKIASCLSSLDELIAAHRDKLEALKDHKKCLMQNLFPQKGQKVPNYRFPEFEKDGEWTLEELEQCLDYLQPTPYLVNSTNYDEKFETPVLTAGKSFVLGYTDEKKGVFKENLPVLIFDDFTTASKFVDFPFKAKSSAMKILLAKNGNNIKFVYESMQTLNYEVGVHKRHWISVFSKLKIALPPQAQEQQKIASCFSFLDELITAQSEKIEQLQQHKKGLMQGLFPKTSEIR